MSTPLPLPKNPQAVFVDVGGVLLLPDFEMIASVLGISAPATELYHAWFRSYARFDPDRPEFDWLWSAFVLNFGVKEEAVEETLAPLRELGDPWHQGPLAAPGAIEFLRRLYENDIPAVMVSNADGDVDQLLKMAGVCQVGIGDGIPVVEIIDSHVVGVRKPDPHIFDFAKNAVELHTGEALDFNRTVHIGDAIWSDVYGAWNAGIPMIHLDPESICTETDGHHDVRRLDDVYQTLFA